MPAGGENDSKYFGIAPDAHSVNVKVGAVDGAVDISQVISAIDWVVEYRNDPGVNIRVLNLSFGTDSAQDRRLDPLSYAAEVAWRKGIVVVASARNHRVGHPRRSAARDRGALEEHGIHRSVDDFGTGYSPLSYLNRLPVDEMKIDRSFVQAMSNDADAAAVVDLGRRLGKRTVAEGVETEQHWRELQALGCDVDQGYLMSRPVEGDQLPAWARSWVPPRHP